MFEKSLRRFYGRHTGKILWLSKMCKVELSASLTSIQVYSELAISSSDQSRICEGGKSDQRLRQENRPWAIIGTGKPPNKVEEIAVTTGLK